MIYDIRPCLYCDSEMETTLRRGGWTVDCTARNIQTALDKKQPLCVSYGIHDGVLFDTIEGAINNHNSKYGMLVRWRENQLKEEVEDIEYINYLEQEREEIDIIISMLRSEET